jgi:3' terminal RNA ribose 2'-O-methyltransferase Hen1
VENAADRMLLTLSTTLRPATDLGYLLAKHPARAQRFELPFGTARVFYPEASDERCTFALVLEVDPVGLVRGRGADETFSLRQYVNDRPYSASSFLSVAIARVLGSALNGHCTARPELVERVWPFEARLPVLPCRGGESLLRSLFEPLGYELTVFRHPLDGEFPEWGAGPYYDVLLRKSARLQDLLAQLYVLVPVLDDDKHYWVGDAEVEKLLARGVGWLADHPERELISRRYLKHQRHLTRAAIARLADEDEHDGDEEDGDEELLERPLTLDEQRRAAVASILEESGARSVADLGCGEGRLLKELHRSRTPAFDRILGMDVSHRALAVARERLELERMPEMQRKRVELIQGSLTYRDARLAGFDAACLVEVVEHVDPSRLAALERVVFEFARPRVVVVTTPNRDYNALFPGLAAGRMRHRDHRFEWSRSEFDAWCRGVGQRNGYAVRLRPVGPEDAERGAPTQMGVFER